MERPESIKHSIRNREKRIFKLRKILESAIKSTMSATEYAALRKEKVRIARKKTKISEALDIQEDLEN